MKHPRKEMLALKEMLGGHFKSIVGLLALLDVADVAVKEVFPDGGAPDWLMSALMPPLILRETAPATYKAFALEVCRWAKDGVSAKTIAKTATNVETLTVLLNSSLKAPLRADFQRVTEWLWARVFPETAMTLDINPATELQASDKEALHEARHTALKARGN